MFGFRIEGSVLLADRHQEVKCTHCGEQFYGRFRLMYDANEVAEEIFYKMREVEYTCPNCLTLIRFQEK